MQSISESWEKRDDIYCLFTITPTHFTDSSNSSYMPLKNSERQALLSPIYIWG